MTEKKEQKSGILKNINVDIFILLIAGIIGIIVSVVLVFFDTENTTAIINRECWKKCIRKIKVIYFDC
ncbi:MAG: hypothetical protein ACTSSF_13565 [Candidatus Heimdallarchaeaceae archaeon]